MGLGGQAGTHIFDDHFFSAVLHYDVRLWMMARMASGAIETIFHDTHR